MRRKSIKINAILSGLQKCCTVLFPLITIPYVSRILGNENYGKVNFGSSIVSYFVLLAALGVAPYAIREGAKIRNNKVEFQEFANQVFTINLAATIISYLGLIALLLFWDKVQDYRLLIVIQATPIIFTTLGIDWINNIYEDFLYTTIRYIILQVISVGLLFLFVKDKEDYYTYAAITAFTTIGGNLINFIYIRKQYISIKLVMKCHLSRHLKPMLYLFGNTIATTIYVNSDITLLTLFKGDAVTGIYSIAVKIYTIIKQFVNAIVGVALPRLSYYLGEGESDEYTNLLNKVFHSIVILIFPGVVGLFILSKNIIDFIAGSEYASGYISLRILAVAIGFAVLSNFFAYAIMIPNRLEKYCLISTIISAILNVLLNFILIPKLSLNGAAITTAVSELIVLILSVYYSKGYYKLAMTFRKLLPCIIGCIGICVVCLIVQYILNSNVAIVGVSIILSSCVYGGIMIFLKDEVVITIRKKV